MKRISALVSSGLILIGLGAGACANDDADAALARSVCDRAETEGCANTPPVSECYAAADQATTAANNADCGSQFNDWNTCLVGTTWVCDADDEAEPEGCAAETANLASCLVN